MIRKTTDKSRGIRLGNFVQIRTIIDEELEQVWAGKKSAKEAWTPPSSAATNSWSASRKPTSPELALIPGGKRVVLEKRSSSKSWLPWVLIAPQMAVILVFFFWPAGQALCRACSSQDAFGTTVEFVGLDNFRNLWNDETYLASFNTTALFSALVASGHGIVADAGRDLPTAWSRVRRSTRPADLALCGGAGRGRRAVAVHVRPSPMASCPTGCARWASTGTTCSTATTPWR
jgi:hypothetical protein